MSYKKLSFERYFSGSSMVPYLHIWESPQTGLSGMTRWDRMRKDMKPKQTRLGQTLLDAFAAGKSFHGRVFDRLEDLVLYKTGLVREDVAPVRRQTVPEHKMSMGILAGSLVRKLNRETDLNLNEALITRCVLFHDIPEGILGKDVPAIFKKVEHDIAEYQAFLKYIATASEESRQDMLYAYLLQFAYENAEEFPEEARVTMVQIRNNDYQSAVFFYFLERYDYLKFALEHFKRYDDPRVLLEVLDGTADRPGGVFQTFDKLVKVFPQLKVIWSDGFRARCEKFITDARMLES